MTSDNHFFGKFILKSQILYEISTNLSINAFIRLHIIKRNSATVKKKALRLVLPYLEPIPLQVRTKIRNAMKNTLNCSKLQVIFKNERKLSNMFRFKDPVPYDIVSGVVYKYRCGRCNFPIMVRQRDT